jgi:putative acetyltransferase
MIKNTDIKIRNETKHDYRIVEELTREAFWNLYVPGCVEHFVLRNLRNSVDFIPELTFVAERAGQIVGHIAYTRGVIIDKKGDKNRVISFGPVSALPELQKQGIGSALITHTINLAKDMGYPGIFIYGDPRYYNRFGFRCAEKYEIKTADDKFAVALQALELKPGVLNNMAGRFVESSAFEPDMTGFEEYDATFPHKEKAETDSQRDFKVMVSLRY